MWLRDREGTEPVNARSPVRLRRVLSVIALVAGVALAAFFAWRAKVTGEEVWSWEAVIAAAVALVAAGDIMLLRRRK
ncbi:DUF6343 family protein [Nonomuraea typhae]|uniref:DUF6343 family protein n=1 Tax=Nonomuraea typhae TaxID=2603600 RepID=A0ABW7YZM8_9ACTN